MRAAIATTCVALLTITAVSGAGVAAAATATATGPSAGTGPGTTAHTRALTLPAPTGAHQVGVANLHLIDRSRPERWDPPKPYRELMVSVVYPAHDTLRYPVAHQMTPGV